MGFQFLVFATLTVEKCDLFITFINNIYIAT